MANNIIKQLVSAVKLPYQYFKTQSSKGDLYDVKKKLKVAENKKNPMYGKSKVGKLPNQYGK